MLKYMYIYIHIHACTYFIHTCDNTYIPYLLETKVVSKQCEEFHLLSMCSLFVGYYPNGMAQYDGTCLPLLRHKLADPAFHSHSLRCVHSDERNWWIMMNLMSPAECPAAFALLSFGYNWNLATQCELATVALTSLIYFITKSHPELRTHFSRLNHPISSRSAKMSRATCDTCAKVHVWSFTRALLWGGHRPSGWPCVDGSFSYCCMWLSWKVWTPNDGPVLSHKKTMFVCICLMSVASTSGRQRNLRLATFL